MGMGPNDEARDDTRCGRASCPIRVESAGSQLSTGLHSITVQACQRWLVKQRQWTPKETKTACAKMYWRARRLRHLTYSATSGPKTLFQANDQTVCLCSIPHLPAARARCVHALNICITKADFARVRLQAMPASARPAMACHRFCRCGHPCNGWHNTSGCGSCCQCLLSGHALPVGTTIPAQAGRHNSPQAKRQM